MNAWHLPSKTCKGSLHWQFAVCGFSPAVQFRGAVGGVVGGVVSGVTGVTTGVFGGAIVPAGLQAPGTPVVPVLQMQFGCVPVEFAGHAFTTGGGTGGGGGAGGV